MQGSVTGLRVVNKTGQPGSEPDITLRGGATITGDNSKALIVVDGIVRNSMSDINPSDIESFKSLKMLLQPLFMDAVPMAVLFWLY